MSTRTIIFICIAITWSGLHNLALLLELYWYHWWFDMPMHFIGGVVVALGFLVLHDLRAPFFTTPLQVSTVLLLTLLVALLWEAFELWAGIPMESDFWIDTSSDVVLGLAGGLVGYWLGTRLHEL